ncbi:unnamed protein product [Schistosoma margrebowiei]|uniref:Uncharacterized protein n=1 Tax=Schistosoma margrebowiei TaxID=48269 RepID=A0A183N629_9TREM|nr:unnamed protein product [Schistosoma margrebowiei]
MNQLKLDHHGKPGGTGRPSRPDSILSDMCLDLFEQQQQQQQQQQDRTKILRFLNDNHHLLTKMKIDYISFL